MTININDYYEACVGQAERGDDGNWKTASDIIEKKTQKIITRVYGSGNSSKLSDDNAIIVSQQWVKEKNKGE